MTNVPPHGEPVNRPESDDQGASRAAGREALEISRLLVEILQVGHVDRPGATAAGRGGASDATRDFHASADVPHPVPEPVAAHVIRAAIHVYTHGPQTIGQLATGLGISQGWASRVVDEMERAGYLERRRDPDDRRVVRVSLAPAAVERVERAYAWRGDEVEAALEGLHADEREVVRTFLERFVQAVRAGG